MHGQPHIWLYIIQANVPFEALYNIKFKILAKMQPKFSHSSPLLPTPYSPLSITLPSALPNALPCFQLTFARRTSRHCFGIFGAVNFFLFSPPVIIIIIIVIATQDQVILTRNYKKYILKQPDTEELCRRCGKESDNPTHYCSMWATSTYRVCKETWWTSQNYPSETGRSSRIDWR